MTRLITRAVLQELVSGGGVTLVDALPPSYYDQQHLPGAVNLIAADVAVRAADLLPDRHAAIVTYCSNSGCGNSEAVAVALINLGYTDVRKYREGIQDWVEAGLPVQSSPPAPITATG